MRHIQRLILLLICLTVLFTASFVGAQEKQLGDLFKIRVDGKYGFIDRDGNIVIQPQFQGADNFSEGFAQVSVGGEFNTAYIDETGKIIIEPKFHIGSEFSEGLAWVGLDPERKPYKLGNLTLYTTQSSHSFNYNIGFIDETGKFIAEPIFAYAGDFSEGLAFVKTKENKLGLSLSEITKPESLDSVVVISDIQ